MASGLGCGDVEEVLVDPEVDYSDEPAYVPQGDPEMDVGFYVEQLYQPLSSGDEMPIVFGLQGGTWSMPAIRVKGLDLEVDVTARLEIGDGDVLGETQATQNLVLANDGWLEVQALPIPVEYAIDDEQVDLEDLYGVDATFTVEVEDSEGRRTQIERSVVMAQG